MDLIFLILTLLLTPAIFLPLKLADGYLLPQIGVAAFGLSLTTIFFLINGRFPVNLSAMLALLYFIYLMTTTGWSTVSHGALRDIPLIFDQVAVFIIASVLFAVEVNMTYISLAVLAVSMFTCLYAIGQSYCFDPLFPQRLGSTKEMLKRKLYNSNEDKARQEGKEFNVDYDTFEISKDDEFYYHHVHPAFENKNYEDSRAISTLGNTNFAAGFFCSTLPFLIYLCIAVSPWFLSSLVVFGWGVVATKSRAGLIGIVGAILFFLIYIGFNGLLFDFLFWSFGDISPGFLALILLVVTYIGAEFLIRTHKIWLKFSEDNPINNRLNIEESHFEHPVAHLRYRLRYWKAAWYLIKKKPLQGYGLRSYRREVYDAQADLNLKDPTYLDEERYRTPQPRECHNDFIENFVEGGAVSGLLFLSIIGVIFYNAIFTSSNFLLTAGVLSGIVCSLILVFFFFPLRMGASAIMIWSSFALLEGISGGVEVYRGNVNPILIIIVIGALAAMLWEGVLKPNIGNFCFTIYNFMSKPWDKEIWLQKAMKFCPRDTIYRTHAFISYLGNFPAEASQHAEVMRQHYDGMTPAWTAMFNSAVANIARKRYDDGVRLLQKALYYLPYFEAAKQELGKIIALAPFVRRMIVIKKISEESVNLIGRLQAEAKQFEGHLMTNQANLATVILVEKVKMSIPEDWVFDLNNQIFLDPKQVSSDANIVPLGIARVPVIINSKPQ